MSIAMFAKDVIVTNNSQQIEAKIIEVSKSEIKYKELDNLDGPTFILPISDISYVIYNNGKKVVYNESTKTTQTFTSAPIITNEDKEIEIYLLSGEIIKGQVDELKGDHVSYFIGDNYYTVSASDIEKVVFTKNRQVREYNGLSRTIPPATILTPKEENESQAPIEYEKPTPSPANPFISRDGNTYYYDNHRMNKSAYRSFLRNRCPAAYEQFSKGYNISKGGWILFGIGLGLDLGCTIASLANAKGTDGLIAVGVIGGALEIASIPTLAVGYSKMHKSVNTYNDQCRQKTSTTYWSLQVDNLGLGLAYHF
jgi:hypothetical protein